MQFDVVNCMNMKNKQLTVKKKRNRRWLSSETNYFGNSKSKEGYGMETWFRKSKEYKINIGHLVHESKNPKKTYALCKN